MGRSAVFGCVLLAYMVSAGCGDDDDGAGAGAGADGAAGEAAAGAGGSSGSAGSRAGSGGSGGSGQTSTGGSSGTAGSAGRAGSAGQAGNAGQAGGATAGSAGGSGGTRPGEPCELECPTGQHCELVQVTCIRAPCNPVPECVDGPASGGSGKLCGTRGSGTCPDGQYCKFPPGADCGRSDAGGSCEPKPDACHFNYAPVCGCDGETYGNDCAAAAAGVSVEREGECGDTSPSASANCDYSKVACDEVPQPCSEGKVREVEGGCYGDCVAVEACKCSSPTHCPMNETYTCHMSAGHCGPYV